MVKNYIQRELTKYMENDVIFVQSQPGLLPTSESSLGYCE